MVSEASASDIWMVSPISLGLKPGVRSVHKVDPPVAAWNVGATHTPLLVSTCVAVHTATVAGIQEASHVISSQSVPLANHATGNHVIFVITQLAGVHRAGVVNVGEVSVLFVRV